MVKFCSPGVKNSYEKFYSKKLYYLSINDTISEEVSNKKISGITRGFPLSCDIGLRFFKSKSMESDSER